MAATNHEARQRATQLARLHFGDAPLYLTGSEHADARYRDALRAVRRDLAREGYSKHCIYYAAIHGLAAIRKERQ